MIHKGNKVTFMECSSNHFTVIAFAFKEIFRTLLDSRFLKFKVEIPKQFIAPRGDS